VVFYKRGRTWYADLGRRNGRRLVVSLRTTEREKAESLYLELARQRRIRGLALDEAILTERQQPRDPVTVAAAIADFLSYSQKHHSPTTIERNQRISRSHLVPQMGTLVLGGISLEAIEHYKAKRLHDGAKPETVNRELQVLRKALNHQVALGKMPSNPLQRFKLLPVVRSEVPVHLLPEQYRALVELAEEPLRTMIVVAVQTGLRKTELFQLTWTRVDLQRRFILVDANDGEWRPKGRKARPLPLNEEAYAALKEHQARTRLRSRYVFCGRTGRPLTTLKTSWTTLRRKTGVKVRWHDLRHTFCSWAIQDGVPVQAVAELLGHADLQMVKRYTHLRPEHLRAAVDTVARASKRVHNGDSREASPKPPTS